jgi:hypothetical protein
VEPDNSRFIIQAARNRRDEALRRAYEAIQLLDESGKPMTFSAVAEAASVSRSWLYRQPFIRAEIDRLQVAQARPAKPLVPSRERASTASQQRRIEALLDESKRLKEENQQLREQVARLLGERRQSRVRRGS